MRTVLRAEFEDSFEQERLGLVAGQLVSRMGASRGHVNALTLMLVWLQHKFGAWFVNAHDVSPGDNQSTNRCPILSC